MRLYYFTVVLTCTLLTSIPCKLHAEEKTENKAEEKTKTNNKPIASKLVAISANIRLEEEDKDLQRLFNHSSNPAARLTFLIQSKNIVQVMEKSVVIKKNNGWKCGAFPKISDTGDAASFVIEKKGDFVGKANALKVTGTIEIQTGTKLVPKSFTLMSYDEPFRMDDFIFTLLEDKLKVEGNHKLIKEINVVLNDETLKSFGSSWSTNTKTYNYKGIDKGAKITFSYWDGLETQKVKFAKK